MILRKCSNCQCKYVSKSWDDVKCPYCSAYTVYKKGVEGMTEEQFICELQKRGISGDIIMNIEYWYTRDTYHYKSMEVATFDGQQLIYFNDWDEGQQNVVIHGYILIDDLHITENIKYVSFDSSDTDPDWVL